VSRAELGACALALLIASGCGSPAPHELDVGAHRVHVIPLPGWEVLAHGRQSYFRSGETVLSLTDVGPVDAHGFLRELRTARALWLAGRRRDAFERVRHLDGPLLRFATSDQRADYWRQWNDLAYREGEVDSASIGIGLDSLMAGARRLPPVTQQHIDEYVLERWSDAWRREIYNRQPRHSRGLLWHQLVTWNRVSHLDRSELAYAENEGYLLVLAVERGPWENTAPAFEGFMSTIEVASDTSYAAR
jgi:hypothetical protein